MRILAVSILLKCGYYTFLVGILARLLVEANYIRFLYWGITGSNFSKLSYIRVSWQDSSILLIYTFSYDLPLKRHLKYILLK